MTKDNPGLLAIAAEYLTSQGGGVLSVVLDEAGDWACTITRHATEGAFIGYGATADEALNTVLGEAYANTKITVVKN